MKNNNFYIIFINFIYYVQSLYISPSALASYAAKEDTFYLDRCFTSVAESKKIKLTGSEFKVIVKTFQINYPRLACRI